MDKRIRTQWVKALRSGKYKQGRGQLKDGNTFCCLGVLCDLFRKSKSNGEEEQWENDVFMGNYTGLPSTVMEWAGLASEDPECRDKSLSRYNDGIPGIEPGTFAVKPKSFKQIATLIEKHL